MRPHQKPHVQLISKLVSALYKNYNQLESIAQTTESVTVVVVLGRVT